MRRNYTDSLLEHWHNKVRDEGMSKNLELYITTRLGDTENVAVERRIDAVNEVQAFLQGDKRVLLLLGDSGVGKSLFGQWLVNDCWRHYHDGLRIPLFIHLPAQKIKTFTLENYLKNHYNFSGEEIRDLQANYSFLLILDAYDEMKLKHRGKNLYRIAKLYHWNVKVIISCRTEALVNFDSIQQRQMFEPYKSPEQALPVAWEKRYVQFFDPSIELPLYIERWKIQNPEFVQKDMNYLEVLSSLPGLLEMIKNPFVLWIVMTALPALLKKHAEKPLLERYHETRLELFNAFTTRWFERQRDKLLQNDVITDAFSQSILEDYRCYSEQLANLMWQENITSITYDSAKDSVYGAPNLDVDRWAALFDDKVNFNNDPNKLPLALIRQGAPLRIYEGKAYAFIHQSLLEYFAAERLFKSAANKITIVLGLEINTQLITNNTAMIRFGVDCVLRDSVFEQALWDIIDESKSEERVAVAAANAITILVAANKSFAGKDLRRIRIKNANLAEGNFEGADLREADLRGVNLCSASLVNANLSGCCLDDVKTGGFFLEELEGNIIACAFSVDGHYYGAMSDYNLDLYGAITHKKLNTTSLKLDTKSQRTYHAFAFIPYSNAVLLRLGQCLQLISLPKVKILRQWEPHRAGMESFATSFDGRWVLTVGEGLPLMIGNKSSPSLEFKCWETATGYIRSSWQCRKNSISAMVVSPDGSWALIAFHGKGGINRWECATGGRIAEWRGHSGRIRALVLSPDGRWALSGSSDGTIKRWDCATGECLATWQGHTSEVTHLSLSTDGRYALTLEGRGLIKSWDCANGECLETFKDTFKPRNLWDGNFLDELSKVSGTKWRSIVLSPNGRWALSGLANKLYRRDLSKGQYYQKRLRLGHENSVDALVMSLDGCWILSLTQDSIILMNSDTGDCLSRWPIKFDCFFHKAMWVSSDGRRTIIGQESKTIDLYDSMRGSLLTTWPNDRKNAEFKLDLMMKKYNSNAGIAEAAKIEDEELNKSITAIAASPDDRWLFTGASDGEIKRWDCSTGQCVNTWGSVEHGLSSISAIALCFDSGWLLVASEAIKRLDFTTGEWTIWQPHNRLLRVTFSYDRYKICSLALSTDGRIALSAHYNGEVRRWNSLQGKCEATWQGHSGVVKVVVISPDNLWGASCDSLGGVILWQLSNGKNSGRKIMSVRSLSWSMKDPSLLIMGFKDGSIKAYTFEAEKLSLRLRWQSSSEKLQLEDCQLLNVHGLSEVQQLFFSQNQAKLQASTKSSLEIIQQRRQRIPDIIGSPRRSLFDKGFLVNSSLWIVTVARCKTGAGAQHAFLILESVEKPSSVEPLCYRIRRIDFVLELRHFVLPEGAAKPEKTHSFGQGLIEIADKTIEEATGLAENSYHCSAQITAAQGGKLLSAIFEDKRQRLGYSKPGSGVVYQMFRMKEAVEHHNCLSWIRKHLEAIEVNIVENHYVDLIAEIPSKKLH